MAQIDWSSFSDEDRQACRDVHATLILAPRTLSKSRVTKLLRELLPKGHVIFGIAAEPHVAGFEDQPQFETLSIDTLVPFEQKIAAAKSPHSLTLLRYPQVDTDDIIRAVRPARVVIVRGSYLYVFHRSSTYALLKKRDIPFELVSPFSEEQEALDYLTEIEPRLPSVQYKTGDGQMMLQLANDIAKRSFDYSFQTGAVIARSLSDGVFETLDAACNEVVPYQTYALHHGNAREMQESAFQDNAHYDTIHAEMNLLVRAVNSGQPLTGTSLFLNLLPCPNCARTLCKTGISEVWYRGIHSDGYALELFEKCGIKARRIRE